MSSSRDDAWMGLALEELLNGLQMGHRPQPSPLTPLSVAGIRRRIPSAEQVDVPPDHRFGPIRVDTTPPRPRPAEAARTPADQGKQPNTDQGPPPLVPLHTTRAPSTQTTQKQTTGGRPSPRAAPQTAGPSTRPHTGQLSTTPTGNQGQPPRAAPRATAPSTRPHTGRAATTTSTGHVTPSPRATPRAALASARARTGPTPTAPGTRAVQAIAPLVPSGAPAAPDPDVEVEAALRECLGDLPPDILEEMARGAEGLDLEDLFGESPDEDGVELPTRPASNQSTDEPRTPSPQIQPDYEEISSDEGVAAEIIQISDSDDAEPSFRPPGTPPPAYEDIFGPGPYATSCPIPTCAASTPSQSPPTTSLARRRAEELSDELGSSSAGPVQPTNPEPRSARDRPPTPAPARRGRRRSAPWADSPSGSSSEEELPRDRQGHARWLPVPDGWSTPNGTLPAGLIRRIQQRLLIARRRARRYLEEEQGQRFRVQLNRDDHVRVFLHPTRK
nr:serine/arginine repetitive matrix protein 2-like [Drosophila kikkawai]